MRSAGNSREYSSGVLECSSGVLEYGRRRGPTIAQLRRRRPRGANARKECAQTGVTHGRTHRVLATVLAGSAHKGTRAYTFAVLTGVLQRVLAGVLQRVLAEVLSGASADRSRGAAPTSSALRVLDYAPHQGYSSTHRGTRGGILTGVLAGVSRGAARTLTAMFDAWPIAAGGGTRVL